MEGHTLALSLLPSGISDVPCDAAWSLSVGVNIEMLGRRTCTSSPAVNALSPAELRTIALTSGSCESPLMILPKLIHILNMVSVSYIHTPALERYKRMMSPQYGIDNGVW